MSTRRRGSGTFSTYVSIDVSDVLDDLSDDDLLDELSRRNIHSGVSVPIPISATDTFGAAAFFDGWIDELRRAAVQNDWAHFRIVANRMRPLEPEKKRQGVAA